MVVYTTPKEIATAYTNSYNERDVETFTDLFHDDAKMLGVTVDVEGKTKIVDGCVKLWKEAQSDENGRSYPSYDLTGSYGLRMHNCMDTLTCVFECLVTMKLGQTPIKLCDAVECQWVDEDDHTKGLKIKEIRAYIVPSPSD